MSHLLRVLSVAALASSTSFAQAQQTIPTQAQPGQVQPGQVQPGQVQPGQVQPGQQPAAQPGQVQPGQVQPGQPGVSQPGRPGQPGAAGMQAQGVSLNAFIAHKLKRGNEAEVELGQLASQRAKTDSVKEFADMMVKSHQEMIQKLEQFDQGVGAGRGAANRENRSTGDNTSNSRQTGNQDRNDDNANRRDNSIAPVDGARNNVRNSESNTDDDPRAADRDRSTGSSQSSSASGANPQSTATPGATQPRTQVAGQAGVNPGGLNGVNQVGPAGIQPAHAGQMAGMSGHVPHMLVAIEDQACDNELQLTKQMLDKHQGEEFEMAYIGQQIVAHTCMLAKLQALKNSGPQQLQQLVAQGEQTTRQHLDQAMKIAKELGDEKK